MFNFDVHGLREVRDALEQVSRRISNKVCRKATREGSNHIRKLVREEVPVETGKTKRSIRVKVDRIMGGGGFIGRIYVGREAWYARLVEFGVQPHKIDPATKKALKFGGRFAKSVEHPGNAANPFMARAAQRARASTVGVVKTTIMAGLAEVGQ